MMVGFSSGNEKIDSYLNELSEEYKELLFKALINRSPSLDNLNISELLRIDNEVKKPLLLDNKKIQQKRQTLFFTGIIYMMTGLFAYVLYETVFRNKLDVIALVSVVVGFTGLFISLYAYISSKTLARKVYTYSASEKEISLASYEVITKWREIEGIANDLNIGDDKIFPHSVIQFFLNNQYITNEKAKELKDFLKLRNEIVHASDATYTQDELINSISKINSIINKLGKIV